MNAIPPKGPGRILVVDDTPANIQVLSATLKEKGYQISIATNGRQALEVVQKVRPDVILLDVMMPEMDGFETCRRLKASPEWRDIPVIFLTARTETTDIVTGFELGAVDYVAKPFNPAELLARVNTHLTMDRLRRENERLLLTILPAPIADRLKAGEERIADKFAQVTVLFGDLVGFTQMSAGMTATEVAEVLNDLFNAFDEAARELGVEKIKTIGDAYMAVCGLSIPQPEHERQMVKLAIRLVEITRRFARERNLPLRLRVGVNSGPVVAGVIGREKFIYDVWGDTVNLASRMEALGVPEAVQVTQSVQCKLEPDSRWEARGPIEVKGKGLLETWLLRV